MKMAAESSPIRVENLGGGGEGGKEEKLLVTSYFSFSHRVFKGLYWRNVKAWACVGELNKIKKKNKT